MNLEFENISETNPVQYLAEHQQVLKLLLRPYDKKPTYRWVDDANSIVFYQTHRDGGPGSTRGSYALFQNGKLIRFSALRDDYQWQNLNYGVSSIHLPESLDNERRQIVNLIKICLEVYSHREDSNWMPVETVNVVVAQNAWIIVPEKYSKRYFSAIWKIIAKKLSEVFNKIKKAILSPLFSVVILVVSILLINQNYFYPNIFILLSFISSAWLVKCIKDYDFNFYFSYWLIGKKKHKNSLKNSLLPLATISNIMLKVIDNINQTEFYDGLEININTINTTPPEYELCFKNTGKYRIDFLHINEKEILELIAPSVFALSVEEKNQLFDYHNIAEVIPKINIKSIPCKKTVTIYRRGVKNFPPVTKKIKALFMIKNGNNSERRQYIISALVNS